MSQDTKNEYNIENEKDYILLMKSGMMWVFHPELTGQWSVDKITILGEKSEERMKAIGQNGNDGLHYSEKSDTNSLQDTTDHSTDALSYVHNTTFKAGPFPADNGFQKIGSAGGYVQEGDSGQTDLTDPNSSYPNLVGVPFIEKVYADWGKLNDAPPITDNSEPKEDKFGPVLESIKSLLDYKNEKYGNSALEPMDIFQGKCKVGQRLDDKLARVKNGDVLKKNDVADLIGYLTLVCVEKGWNNFDEFKD